MIVYLHPSLFSAGWITQTNILDLQDSVSLTDDPKNVGYIVLAPEGRKTTHYYPFPDNKGVGWDNWYRQMNPAGDVRIGNATWRENADAATIDHFIATEVATGNVDTRRIYVTGWSNGAAMGVLYSVNRPNIAASAVYSAPNPFGAFNDPCPQTPVAGRPATDKQIQIFNPAARTMHIHNACDVGGICPNGELLATELNAAGVVVDDVILDNHHQRVHACTDSCGTDPQAPEKSTASAAGSMIGLGNHMRWPKEWTTAMLDFFRQHPLKTAP
jgi:dienelactone hydrolase